MGRRLKDKRVNRGGRVSIFDEKSEEKPIVAALAGNPNVGKSTLFNSLTGMHAHTGNWAGKTVGVESGRASHRGREITLVDIPGTYSLLSHSDEEKIARDYIAFGGADITVVVCDACALKQNLNLVLQILETGRPAVVAVNLMDEARRRGVSVDIDRLSELLGVPVVGTVAHKKATLTRLLDAVCEDRGGEGLALRYPDRIEKAVRPLAHVLSAYEKNERLCRFFALRLIDSDEELRESIIERLKLNSGEACKVLAAVDEAISSLFAVGIDGEGYKDAIVSTVVSRAEEIAQSVTVTECRASDRTRRIDKILTGRVTAYPLMLLLLALVFFITLSLANYPSEWLSVFFSFTEARLAELFDYLSFPDWVTGVLLEGVYRTLGQVVAVMLPPMAIFFPLFSLLEDSGYLPRIAYNLDRPFCCAGACGKQALTMCMGFGCNAVGIVGCRIIDSKRERNLAIVTNSLVPCNGRLPMLVTLISVFYLFFMESAPSLLVSLTLSLFIVLGIAATFLSTLILSRTLMRGARSSFTIELPPYRRPRFFSTVFRSLTDKCASVLLRAVTVAAPIGLVIWVLANIYIGGESVLASVSDFLDPVGRLFGMDGAILFAFILGIPANEIVIPILLVIYSTGTSLGAETGIDAISALLTDNGWTPVTAVCTAIFALFHWPCSTSLITVYKETKSLRYSALAFVLPTVWGLAICFLVSLISNLLI